MAGRTLDTLLVLVQNRGRLLDKDELLSLIWPGTVVDEANLSQSIFTVRKLLGDSPRDHRYIATVAGRGYQFVAPVRELGAEPAPSASAVAKEERQERVESASTGRWIARHPRFAIPALAVIAAGAAGLAWGILRRPPNAPSDFVERRLTFNSSANEVGSALISPDGKYFAYSDPAGIHVRLLSTGEEQLIPATAVAPAGASLGLDAWFPNGTELLGHTGQAGGGVTTWAMSIMGRASRELRAGAMAWSVSPDGKHIAFSPADGGGKPEIWVMDDRGDHPRKVLGLSGGENLWCVRWAPDGRHLAYLTLRAPRESLETCDLNGANRTAIVVAPGLGQWVRSLWWLPDGRIIYAQAEAADVDANLWQIGVDNSRGGPLGKPRRITRWAGVDIQGLNATADGTRVVLRKESFPSQIYVGELSATAKRVRPPRRLTNDEAVDWGTAWTADSKAVLFSSDRGGKWGIFKLAVAQGAQPEALIAGRENANLARVSPDGSWVFYSEKSLMESGHLQEYRVMRIPVAGGPPAVVYQTTNTELQDYPCARAPANRCVLIEESQDRKRITASALDPLKGKGELLRTVEKEVHSGFHDALSPDGSTLALAKDGELEGHIRLLSLTDGPDREIAVKNWPNLASVEWSPDGKGLYCGSVNPQSGTLLYVDLHGVVQVVSQSTDVGGGAFIGAVPSPDGRYLALTGAIHYSNAWLVEGF